MHEDPERDASHSLLVRIASAFARRCYVRTGNRAAFDAARSRNILPIYTTCVDTVVRAAAKATGFEPFRLLPATAGKWSAKSVQRHISVLTVSKGECSRRKKLYAYNLAFLNNERLRAQLRWSNGVKEGKLHYASFSAESPIWDNDLRELQISFFYDLAAWWAIGRGGGRCCAPR